MPVCPFKHQNINCCLGISHASRLSRELSSTATPWLSTVIMMILELFLVKLNLIAPAIWYWRLRNCLEKINSTNSPDHEITHWRVTGFNLNCFQCCLSTRMKTTIYKPLFLSIMEHLAHFENVFDLQQYP